MKLPGIRLMLRCAGALVCFALAVLATTSGAAAAPYVPADEGQVLERLPTPGTAEARELRHLRALLAADPDNLALATELAERWIAVGRREQDPRYMGYAQAALRPWWDQADAPVDALVLRAAIHQNRHAFDAALADLAGALRQDSRNLRAWLSRSTILLVQGRPEEALASCAPLRRQAEPLAVAACEAGAMAVGGRAEAAYALLDAVLARRQGAVAPELEVWARTILAETAALLSRDAEAEQQFNEALRLGPDDTYLLNAYADFLLDRDRAAEARPLVRGDLRNDGRLLRLALAEHRLAPAGAAPHIVALEARFAAASRRGDPIHQREEARFALVLKGEPERALALAEANWRVQREPWDVRVLLEAALAAGSPEAAAPVLEWLDSTGLEDVRIRALADRVREQQS